MARRKKTDTADAQTEDTPEEAANALRLLFRGEMIELVPTAEYPFQVLQTEEYKDWINSITDLVTKARITGNVNKMRRGLFGDWKEIDAGVFEMRMDFGPGYRVYYARHEKTVIILLGGGVKNRQQRDIGAAKMLWKEVENEIKQV